MIDFSERADILIRFACGALIAFGCYLVVQPFMTAILLSAIIVVVSWPLFLRLNNFCQDKKIISSFLMVLILTFCVIIPLSLISIIIAQQLPGAVTNLTNALKNFTMPTWIETIPYIGPWLQKEFVFTIEPAAIAGIAEKIINPISQEVLNFAVVIGKSLVQIILVVLISFFFYKDGEIIARKVLEFLERVSGDLSAEFSVIAVTTTRSVVYGIVGTALGQAIVAFIGFAIAGVPGALLLSIAVFVLSVVPVGPPLVWGPVAFWLYSQHEIGMAVFMVLWGLLAVASVDNFLKPLLIARGSPLPLSLVFLGVFGGVIAFGILGLIIGPVVLAVGVSMFKIWLGRRSRSNLRKLLQKKAPEPNPQMNRPTQATTAPRNPPRRNHPKTFGSGRKS
ncbi:MAG TPA: AI-2E family transporter [Sutterella sp.]|nr:AI-2E family transporter [Sutterella sp.]